MQIDINSVIKLLIEENILMGDTLIEHKKPEHGPCCTCQECGYHYDDCVCQHNNLLRKIKSLSKE